MTFPFLQGRHALTESVDRQLGEITATLRAFREDLVELKISVVEIAKAQSASSEDRRTQQLLITSRLDSVERTTAGQHATNTQKLDTLAAEISAMKEPVAQFVAMRKRVGGIIVAATATVGFLWEFAEPLYNYLVSKLFTGHG